MLSQHEVRYPYAVERLVHALPFFLLLDTSLFETLLIHPCTMSQSRYITRVISYIDSPSLFADLSPGSCHTMIPVPRGLRTSSFADPHLIAFRTPLVHVNIRSS